MPPLQRAQRMVEVLDEQHDWLQLGLETAAGAHRELLELLDGLSEEQQRAVIAGASEGAAHVLCLLHANKKIGEHSYELALRDIAQVG